MTTRLEGRIAAFQRRLLDGLRSGTSVTITASEAGADYCGRIAWTAAARLIVDGHAIKLGEREVRIIRGPRPHTRFRTIVTIKRERGDAF